MNKNKKAQGISLNVIIIAAIALLVLVILSVVFIGRTKNFTQGVADCRANGGEVKQEAQCDAGSGYTILPQINADNPDTTEKEVCCVKI